MLAQETIITDLNLPAGYQARPARLEDAEAIAVMCNAVSQALLGEDQLEAAQWLVGAQMPNFNLDTDTRLLLAPDGSLAGFAEVWDFNPHTQVEQEGRVHPAHTGRGLGSALLAWAEARARLAPATAAPGARVVLHSFINRLSLASRSLLAEAGHKKVRENLRMIIELDAPPPAPVWPAGLRARNFVPGQDDRAALSAIRDAFRDHWGNAEGTFDEALEQWQHWIANDKHVDPSLWFLAVDDDDQVQGTSLARLSVPEDPGMGWVHSLGVQRPWRRQGAALALLRQSIGALYARGQRRVGLGVDAESLTGATRLYEKAGMSADPRHHYEIWEKELQPGA